MKLIVGLGNPGAEYENTRHNIGFLAIDWFAEYSLKDTSWKLWGSGKSAQLLQANYKGEKVILIKPLTYMNLSGKAIVEAAHFFKILPEEICILHDDLDLPFTAVRLKEAGGDGGHNGLKSATQSLSSNEYVRIRLGIGRPEHADHEIADYVLSDFKKSDEKELEEVFHKTSTAIEAFIAGPEVFKKEMNHLNRRK